MQNQQSDLYNAVLLRNPMQEDFIFGYDNKMDSPEYNEEGNYIIRAGETRAFPKFIARVAMKHLIDRILMKKDKDGKLINNSKERDAIASIILVREESYDRPVIPTDREIVDQMEGDMERIIAMQKNRLADEKDASLVTPNVDENVVEVTKDEDSFEGLEEPKVDTTSREDLYKYASDILKVDLDAVFDTKNGKKRTFREVYDKMSTEELVTEFQIEGDINA